jgi:hypothetical protein
VKIRMRSDMLHNRRFMDLFATHPRINGKLIRPRPIKLLPSGP